MMFAKYFLKPTIISRADWKAEKPKHEGDKLTEEVSNLVVAFTGTEKCETKDVCMRRVKDIQKKDMEETNSDIKYNFLIGGDGNVYEGRGWRVVPEFSKKCRDVKRMKGNVVQVAFIGENGVKPSIKMLKAFAGLLLKGVEEKVIVQDVKKLNPCVLVGDKVHTLKGALSADQMSKGGDKRLLEEYKKLSLQENKG